MIGDDRWLYREGKRDGHDIIATTRDPLDRTRWPEFDHHVRLTLGYGPHWRTGLPRPKELTRLQDFEDELIERLIATDSGQLVATETTQGRRTLHLYLRPGCPLLDHFRGRAGEDAPKRGPWVTVAHDAEWSGVAHLVPVQRAA